MGQIDLLANFFRNIRYDITWCKKLRYCSKYKILRGPLTCWHEITQDRLTWSLVIICRLVSYPGRPFFVGLMLHTNPHLKQLFLSPREVGKLFLKKITYVINFCIISNNSICFKVKKKNIPFWALCDTRLSLVHITTFICFYLRLFYP